MMNICSKMVLPQWLIRLKSSNSASGNSSPLENGTELANVGPDLHRSEQIMSEINDGRYVALAQRSERLLISLATHVQSVPSLF